MTKNIYRIELFPFPTDNGLMPIGSTLVAK